jgi:hypothetical protein
MAQETPGLSADIEAAVLAHARADARAIQRLELGLAELVCELGPPGSRQHLDLVAHQLDGIDVEGELREARQDCWSYQGSQACGCSAADVASAAAIMACSEPAAAAHALAGLTEQVWRVLRCGIGAERVLAVLTRVALALLLLTATAAPVHAAPPKRDPPLLFGGAVKQIKAKVPLDPRLPTGSLLPATEPRPSAPVGLCSFARPVCVHSSPARAAALPDALAALERAYERIVLGLRLPAPSSDADRGGNDGLDWYLEDAGDEVEVVQEALLPGTMDEAAVFCRGGSPNPMLRERDATLCVGEALASSLDPGESSEARRALALELWWIVGLKTALDVQVIDDAQRNPERALARDDEASSGSLGRLALLFEMLETTRSVAAPGTLVTSLFSAAASRTPPAAVRFDNEPDLFDVLRHSLDEDTTRYADLLVDFALRRALSGDRDDGTRLPSLSFAGSFARAGFDWIIPFSSLPRRVLSGRPIAQSGAELIWVELDDAPLGAAVGFRAEWEAPVAFQWRIVLIDAQGREVRRADVTFQERATAADARVLRLDGAKAMIIAGVNLGGVDLAHPFDPDVAPFEPSACTVYLVAM